MRFAPPMNSGIPGPRRVHILFLISHVSPDASGSRKRGSPGGGQPAASSSRCRPAAKWCDCTKRSRPHRGRTKASRRDRRGLDAPQRPRDTLFGLLVSNSSDTSTIPYFRHKSHLVQRILPDGVDAGGKDRRDWLVGVPWSVVAAKQTVHGSLHSTETIHEMDTGSPRYCCVSAQPEMHSFNARA